MILTFSQERKGVTATFREESSGRCDQMVVRPNAKAAKTLTPQCDLSPIWNLCGLVQMVKLRLTYPYAFFAISTIDLKPAGSWMAISLRALRFSVTPALMRPAMNFE